ncbi:MAG: TetR/AcrR family transcriptional regulator [Lachnospiraceae bacterium]|nr:TetR/AcrR family transcriptional regulator [Lachnospiraceae bacterium]
MELRETVLEGAIKAFNKKGLKFTMDDIAKELSISKKTIYTVFKDKEELSYAAVDYLFDFVKEGEKKIILDPTLTTVEKLRKILAVMPDGYKDIDYGQLYQLKDKYPKIYAHVAKRLETGWEGTIALIERGMEEKVIRPINIGIVKMMLEASWEQFYNKDVLKKNKLTYQEALNEVVDIIMKGIEV